MKRAFRITLVCLAVVFATLAVSSITANEAQAGVYYTWQCHGGYGAVGGSMQLNWSGYMGATGGNSNAGMGSPCRDSNPAKAWNTNSQWSSPVYGYRNYWNGCASRDGYGNCVGGWVCCEVYVQYYNYGWNTGSGWTKWGLGADQGNMAITMAYRTDIRRSDYGWGAGWYFSNAWDWNGVLGSNLGGGTRVDAWSSGSASYSPNPTMVRSENYGGSAQLGSDGYGPFGQIFIYNLRHDINDWSAPGTTTTPKSGWTRGTQNLTVDWTDNSGIENAVVGSAASSGNGQTDKWLWATDPGCNYVYTKPCSNQNVTTSYNTADSALNGNGYRTLSFLANDAGANAGTATRAIAIDNSAPTTTVGTNNGAASVDYYSSNASWTVSCADNGSAGCHSVSLNNGNNWSDGTSSWVSGSSTTGTVTSCGATTVYGASRDNSVDTNNNVGNQSSASAVKYFDNCAPTNSTTIPSFVWRASGSTIPAVCADSHVGMGGINLTVTPAGGSPSTTSTAGSSASIAVTSAGPTAFSVWCSDKLGNTSSTVSGTLLVDNTNPTISGSCPSTWSSTTVTCSVSSSDTWSGLKSATGFRWWKSGVAQANATMTQTADIVTATGGATSEITQNGQRYRVHRFDSSGTFNISSAPGGTPVPIEYLVVGGGGGGGGVIAGGGGGGGMLEGQTPVTTGTNYTVTVGGGGTGGLGWNNYPFQGTSGGNSSISGSGLATVTALGGGGGGGYGCGADSRGALSGGSGGGGGSCAATAGAAGTAGQGNAGGNGAGNSNTAGGGGGAGGAGAAASASVSGAGGSGRNSSITGATVTYAGGGGGGVRNGAGSAGAAGSGGGGVGSTTDGTVAASNVNGTANTGGGGGGCGHNVSSANRCGGNGGSGVVIIRYPIGPATGTGTITVSGDGLHTITAQTEDAAGNTSQTATIGQAKIDTTTPTGEVEDPSPNNSYLRNRTFTPIANIADNASGVSSATIQIQYNSGSWTNLTGCTLSQSGEGITSAVVRCTPPNLSAVAAGSTIGLRVQVTDVAGASSTSAVVSNTYAPTAPATTVVDPSPSSAYLRGSFTPTGTITDSVSGAASDAAIQARYGSTSATAWADMPGCALSTNQIGCSSFNTTSRTSGTVQDMRVRGMSNAGVDEYSSVIDSDNPVAYFQLEEPSGTVITNDGSSKTRGVLSGTASYRVAGPPAIGDPYGMGFNGSSTSISVADSSELDPTTAATTEAWFKSDTNATDEEILRKDGQYALRLTSSGRISALFYIGGAWQTVTTPASPRYDDNAWHLVNATYDGSDIRVYVDGTQVATAAASGSIATSNNNLIIGSTGSANYVNGSLAHVAVYPTALSAAKVLSHWQATSVKVSNTIDNTAPTLTANYPSGQSSGGWYKTAPVTISASATDAHSGMKQISWTINGAVPAGSPATGGSASIAVPCTSGGGTYTVVITAEDNIGNTSNQTLTIKCDTGVPTMTNPCPSAWSNVDVTCVINSAGADSLSGIQGYRVRQVTSGGSPISGWSSPLLVAPNAQFTVSENGTTYWEMQSVDNADNYSASQTATIKVDKVSPNGGQASAGGSAFVRGQTTLTNPTASDVHSGIASMAYRVSLSSANPASWSTICTINTSASPYSCNWNTTATADGLYRLYAIATDAAGNAANSTEAVPQICVDNTAPSSGALTLATAPATIGGNPAYRGNVLTSTTASDTGCGQIDKVKVQFREQGTTTWNDAASDCDNMPATGGGAYGCSLKTTVIPDGIYEIRSFTSDKAGNEAGGTVRTIVIDNQGPSVTLNNIAAWLKGNVSLSASATDSSGVIDLKIQVSPTGLGVWTLADASCVAATGSLDCIFNSTAYEENTCFDFRAQATDSVGNVGVSSSRNQRCVDNTAPTEILDGYTSDWVNSNMQLTLRGTDGGSGLKDGSYKWQLGENEICPLASPTTATAPVAFETPNTTAEGKFTLCTRVSDQLDNWSTWQKRVVQVDKTDPTTEVTGVPDSWTNQTPDIKVKGTDQVGLSGIYKVFWKIDSGAEQEGADNTGPSITESGSYALSARSKDVAGNWSQSVSKQVKIDKINPVDTTNFTNAWYSQAQDLTIAGTDQANLSGVSKVAWKRKLADGSFTTETEIANPGASNNFSTVVNFGTEGINEVYTRVFDRAGNATESQKVEFGVDLTNPTISQEGGSDEWFNTDRTVTLTANDSQSGVARIEWQYCNAPSAEQAACVEATASQQSEPGASDPYYTDVETPAKSGSEYPPATENFSGQTTATKTLTFTQPGDRYLRARTVDRSGRTSGWTTIHVAIDKTDPTTRMSGQDGRVNGIVELVATSEDSSGIGRSGVARGWFQVCKSADCDAPDAVWRNINQESLVDVPAPACTPDMVTTDGTFRCNFDTRQYSDGQYSIRSVVRDAAGNTGYGSPRLDGQRFRNGTFCPASL